MLSKVLSHRSSARVQAYAFATLGGFEGPKDRVAGTEDALAPGDGDVAALQEKLREVENQAAAEQQRAFEAENSGDKGMRTRKCSP
jgi:hypothetical protein